jgi:hypothetical protein
MKTEQTDDEKKKIYEKPLLRIVDISDGIQVLGIGCKSMTVGVLGPTRNPCVPGIRCNQPGS